MSWASELPSELICRPLGLVVLTGLDITYNAIHKAIWDAFCNNRRPDRVPLQFKVFDLDHEYPKCRSKRTTYEWYIPKGILKTSWMSKHLEEVPALVVIFFDLDWDEAMWKERQMECSTKVEIVRNSLLGRSCRVAVVLIQRNAPLPPGEDVVAAERAASLCSACDLSAKSLFVLPHSDHLLGYTIRLENAFYELTQSYYHTEARRVKAHKEFLNKTTHQLLYVRHQFKIAFYNELKQDTHTALKHYKQAYVHILDLRMHDTNLLEIKVISGFISYKICRLSFQHNTPLDAISQFRRHADFFKFKVGAPELAFEHSAWMSKQFQVFGDLFDEAIKTGLTAIQTQHPGFYYQQAANHAIARKQLCKGLCHAIVTPPDPDPLENLQKLDYYGQRPWRQGHQSIDPPDALKERDGNLALQNLELKEDHSWQIIPLLSSAVSQFKKYKSPRMKRNLMITMGEEYYHAKDYHKGLALLLRVTWDYRQDRWWPLLTSVLNTMLKCAFLVADIENYVKICTEMMGKYTCTSPDEKTRIQMNLIRVMNNESPEAEPGCNAECVENAKVLWKEACQQTTPCLFTLHMQDYAPFVDVKVSFSEEEFTADKPMVLHVLLRTNCQFPMRFSRLSLKFSSQAYQEHCVVTSGTVSAHDSEPGGDLYLEPGKVKVHTFQFMPQPSDVNKSVSVTSIALQMGSEDARCAIFLWNGTADDAVTTIDLPRPKPPRKKLLKLGETVNNFNDVDCNYMVRVLPREACMDIKATHEPPCLVNEFYLLKLNITNKEHADLNSVCLQVGVKEGGDILIEQSTHVSLDKPEFDGQKVIPRRNGIDLGNVPKDKTIEKQVFLKCLQPGTRILHVKVSYTVTITSSEGNIDCVCHKEEEISLETEYPFDVKIKCKSLQFESLTAVHAEEPFLLMADINCTSPWPISIQNSALNLSPYVKLESEAILSQVAGLKLKKNDQASECQCLIAPAFYTTNSSYWPIFTGMEEGVNDVPYVSTRIELPMVTVEHIPLSVDVDLPAQGFVRVKLPITYTIHNRTPYSQELELSMETSDAFMFSGHKQLHFRVLPSGSEQINYCLYPLLAGSVALPKLHINMLRYPNTMDNIIQKMIPTHVYILPSGKNIERPQITAAS